jgi:hypothetical protein
MSYSPKWIYNKYKIESTANPTAKFTRARTVHNSHIFLYFGPFKKNQEMNQAKTYF